MTIARQIAIRTPLVCALASTAVGACANVQEGVCKWENRANQPPQVSTLVDLAFDSANRKFFPLDVEYVRRHFGDLPQSAVPFRNIQGGASTRDRISISYVYPTNADQKTLINLDTLYESQFWPFIRKTMNASPALSENRVFSDVTRASRSSSIFAFYFFDEGDNIQSKFADFKKNNRDILGRGKLNVKSVPGCLVSTVTHDDRNIAVSAFYAPRSRLKSFDERATFLSCREQFFSSMWGFHDYAFQDPRSFNARPKWTNSYQPRGYVWKYRKFQDLIRNSAGSDAEALCNRLLPEVIAQ